MSTVAGYDYLQRRWKELQTGKPLEFEDFLTAQPPADLLISFGYHRDLRIPAMKVPALQEQSQ